MTSEIRTNTITSRAGLSTVTFTDSGPMFSGITTFVDNSTFSVGTGGTIHAPATNVMALGTNSIDAIKIDSSGNISIAGITTMTGNLTINSTSNARAIILPDNKRIYFGDGEDFWIGSNGTNGEVSGSLFYYNHQFYYDNVRLRIGNGQDLDLFHNGTDSYIDNNTGNLYLDSASNIIFETGSSTERLRITSDGKLVTNSASSIDCGVGGMHLYLGDGARNDYSTAADGLIIEKNGTTGLSIDPGSSGNANIYFPNESNHSIASISHNNSNGEFRIRGEDHIILSTNGNTERVRIASDGDVGIGTNSPLERFHVHKASATGPFMYITNTSTGVSASDGIQMGFDGNNSAVLKNNENTDWIFYTNGNERSRITAAGQTQLTISSNGNVTTPLRLWNAGSNAGANVQMLFYNGDGSTTGAGALARIVAVDEGNYDSSLMFETANKSGRSDSTTAHMKLTKDGRLGIGQVNINSIDSKLFIQTSGTSAADGITFKSGSGSTGAKFFFATTNPDRSKYIQHSGYWMETGCHPNEGVRFRDAINNAVRFYMDGGSGNYNFTGSNVSDRNLKENIETITVSSIDLIKQVIPRTFNWKFDNNNTPHGGFIAQEMQPLFPKLVNGKEYDESKTDYNGSDTGTTGGCNPTGMGFDYNGYTAYLTKAMQELIAKVETLEQENNALKERVRNLEG